MEKLKPQYQYYKLAFYVPESHLEQVKQALFKVGAGKQGNYENCCWQCLGQGQFRPLASANPAVGTIESLNYIAEYKVEILCPADCIKEAVEQLKKEHPYEEPAFEVIRLEHV
ncbi:hypothetical protein [Legionella jordanis]|uniref:Structural toxin protein (Hemagglutinin/hemolysin) RtxA n=1 Tax=Legionella jordanis TaxID=456 RepID=A0A0W0VAF5_9GAMM|nr:hypothetical protein [Legionella jordanis]KTD17143.1 structural toxin protein (hemagglutinin/hemolysin) RtxA [Legionella jordanis]RMX03268.1 NGG1p interacting factor NIF3 [Legionella jordanis]RMX18246.1 NGG1p interacting factor NIF3 [Legionella jordanis]VEH12659.1 structural toxin protein (hemagglutinin/hemolysin) RtxA [Legionella jordanis]HAT8713268.1 NGG1p interacting factor NIF3 [Legionella jordanis]